MNTLQVAQIKAATIGIPTGRGGAKAASPADCMKDCIAWYSPKRQGITNEYLQDHYLDDDAVLQDLSGNGNHIALHNMEGEEGGGYVNDDGDLVFDGVDDYGILDSFIFPDRTAFVLNVDANGKNPANNSYILNQSKQNYGTIVCVKQGQNNTWNMGYGSAGNSTTIRRNPSSRTDVQLFVNLIKGECPFFIYKTPEFQLSPSSTMLVYDKNEDNPLLLCNTGSIYTQAIFKDFIVFRRNLTYEEAKWVYDNILTTD